MPALCVSIHDVAPVNWNNCRRVIAALHAVAPVALSLLVVPRWHGHADAQAVDCYAELESLRLAGHELVLHGYTHLDTGPPPDNFYQRFKRRVITRSEGEFAALDFTEAQQKIHAGLRWFGERGWKPQGFVAPAWMMSKASVQALAASGLSYTSTYGALLRLPYLQILRAPALVYSARNRIGDALVRALISQLAAMQMRENIALIRLGLHPADAASPATMLHMQRLLDRLLRDRMAMTKSAFVQNWQPNS